LNRVPPSGWSQSTVPEPTIERPAADDRLASTIRALTKIWQDVFGRRLISLEENFFELGGNPTLAVRLSSAIRNEFGRVIPPVAIYAGPTIRGLAHMLCDHAPAGFPSIFLLRAGSGAPPLFMTHGLGGNIMEFFDLLKWLKSPGAVYGLQAKGSEGLDCPFADIEAMSEYHLKQIRDVQLRGPYLLCGYSFGGLVALEIARRLRQSGEEIALLSMIDSYPHVSSLPLAQKLRWYVERAGHEVTRLLHPRPAGGRNAQEPATESEYVRKSVQALETYRPRPYTGRVRFIRAQIPSVFPANPVAQWRGVLGELEVTTVPGDHHGILRTTSRELASILSQFIAEALAGSARGSKPD
jgi:acetoacetyl-CoA synthetase